MILTKKRCTRCLELKIVTEFPEKGIKKCVMQFGVICKVCLQIKEDSKIKNVPAAKIPKEPKVAKEPKVKKESVVVQIANIEKELLEKIASGTDIKCNSCGVVKPQSEFYKDRVSNGIQRYRGECKICSQVGSKERTKKYNDQKSNLTSDFTEKQWRTALAYFDCTCAYCNDNNAEDQDHVIPVKDGGGYTVGNILPACHRCNASKGASSFTAWYPTTPWFTMEKMTKILDYLKSVTNN